MKPELNGGAVADLDGLFDDHDKNPNAAAEALRAMANEGVVAEQDHRRFAWLVNHVIGEKEGDWSAAFDILDKTVADSREVPCIVHRAVAALGSGKPLKAFSLIADIAEKSECSYAAADAAVKLLVLQLSCADEPVLTLVDVFNGVLRTWTARSRCWNWHAPTRDWGKQKRARQFVPQH